jgi:cytochrome c5
MKFKSVKNLVCSAVVFAAVVLTSAVSAQLKSPSRPRVLMPDGPARQVLRDNCVSCHGIDEYGFYSLDRESWDRFINETHTGDYSVGLTGGERDILLDYLDNSFGKNDIALPRDYQYLESEFFSDADGRVFMESYCSGCHAHGLSVAFDRQDTLEGWTSILRKERDRGTVATPDDFARKWPGRFTDEMLEKAAQWLAKVRSVDGS